MIKKLLTAVLATSVALSSVIAGGADSFVSPSVALAAEGDSNIPAGIYSVPIVRTYSENNSSIDSSSPLHFYPRAILNVDEAGISKLTIGVENWSLYEAFIPRKQGYFNENNNYLPATIFNEENTHAFTNFNYTKKYIKSLMCECFFSYLSFVIEFLSFEYSINFCWN